MMWHFWLGSIGKGILKVGSSTSHEKYKGMCSKVRRAKTADVEFLFPKINKTNKFIGILIRPTLIGFSFHQMKEQHIFVYQNICLFGFLVFRYFQDGNQPLVWKSSDSPSVFFHLAGPKYQNHAILDKLLGTWHGWKDKNEWHADGTFFQTWALQEAFVVAPRKLSCGGTHHHHHQQEWPKYLFPGSHQ